MCKEGGYNHKTNHTTKIPDIYWGAPREVQEHFRCSIDSWLNVLRIEIFPRTRFSKITQNRATLSTYPAIQRSRKIFCFEYSSLLGDFPGAGILYFVLLSILKNSFIFNLEKNVLRLEI